VRDCRLMLVGAVVAAGLAGATPARAEEAAEPKWCIREIGRSFALWRLSSA